VRLLIISVLTLLVCQGCDLRKEEKTFAVTFVVMDHGASNALSNVDVLWAKVSYPRVGDFEIEKQPLLTTDAAGTILIAQMTFDDSVQFVKPGYHTTSCTFSGAGKILLVYPDTFSEGDAVTATESRDLTSIITIPLIRKE
jgi:hypothetical protein